MTILRFISEDTTLTSIGTLVSGLTVVLLILYLLISRQRHWIVQVLRVFVIISATIAVCINAVGLLFG